MPVPIIVSSVYDWEVAFIKYTQKDGHLNETHTITTPGDLPV